MKSINLFFPLLVLIFHLAFIVIISPVGQISIFTEWKGTAAIGIHGNREGKSHTTLSLFILILNLIHLFLCLFNSVEVFFPLSLNESRDKCMRGKSIKRRRCLANLIPT